MTWCLISTFCPESSKKLQTCLNGQILGWRMQDIPIHCLNEYKSWDKCLIQATKDYEKKKTT